MYIYITLIQCQYKAILNIAIHFVATRLNSFNTSTPCCKYNFCNPRAFCAQKGMHMFSVYFVHAQINHCGDSGICS